MTQPLSPEPPSSFPLRETSMPASPKTNVWLRWTSTGWDTPQETIEQREKVRRSRLTSWILLGLLLSLVAFIPATFSDKASAFTVLIALVLVVVAIVLNRKGFVTTAGILLVALSSAAVIGVVLGSADGKIHLVYLPAYDVLVIPVILGASILPRRATFVIAGVNVALIYGDLFFQHWSPDLQQAITQYGMPVIAGRPVTIQIMTAVIAFLWVRGMDQAVRRADRAEELRAIQLRFTQAEVERTAQVEEFVQEIINALRALANGQEGFIALPEQHLLHQQAIFINNQLRQFHRLKQGNNVVNEQTVYSAHMLLTLLQRINSGQSILSGLDPRQFTTPTPVINEIAWYLYFMLQGRNAPAK